MKKLQLSDLIALMFILLFTYAGWTKLLDYQTFREQLATFDYISGFAGFLALAMPLIHLGLALLFIWQRMRIWALWLSFMLLLLYSVYIAIVLYGSNDMPCACSGIFRFTSWTGQLAINSVFLAAAFAGIFFHAGIPDTKRNFNQ